MLISAAALSTITNVFNLTFKGTGRSNIRWDNFFFYRIPFLYRRWGVGGNKQTWMLKIDAELQVVFFGWNYINRPITLGMKISMFS